MKSKHNGGKAVPEGAERENLTDLEDRILAKTFRNAAPASESTTKEGNQESEELKSPTKEDRVHGMRQRTAETSVMIQDVLQEFVNGIAPLPWQNTRRDVQPGAYAEAGGSHSSIAYPTPMEAGQRQETLDAMEAGILSSNLAVARPVAALDAAELPQGVEDTKERRSAMQTISRNTERLTVGLVIFGLASIAAIVTAFVTTSSEEQVFAPALTLSTSPSESPTLSEEDRVLGLFPGHTIKQVEESGSPQHLAFQWLTGDPMLSAYPEWRLQQRFALATLYFATGGDRWTHNGGWLDYSLNECLWEFRPTFDKAHIDIYYNQTHTNPCEVDVPDASGAVGQIKHIWLRENNVRGQIPPELYLLTHLRTINIRSNFLSGTIASSLGQLTDLEMLALLSNELTGTLPVEVGLPLSLVGLWVTFNRLEGTVSCLSTTKSAV